jgi:hypothetical protein
MFAGLFLAVRSEFGDDGLHVTLRQRVGRREHGHRLAAFGDGDGLALLHLAEQSG